MKYEIVEGNLIDFIKEERIDVAIQGNNCFCNQGSGISVPIKLNFGTDKFPLEAHAYRGDINKLGGIDFGVSKIHPTKTILVNCYTQFRTATISNPLPLNYHAVALCLEKINYIFPNSTIGIPYLIGCGLAGGNEEIVLELIDKHLYNCRPIIVKLP